MASGDSPGLVRLHLRSPLNRHHCPDLGDISSQQQVQRHQHHSPHVYMSQPCICLFILSLLDFPLTALFVHKWLYIRMEFSGDKAEEGNLKTVRILL